MTTTDTDRHCNDLTQLSSREQLSALMDGALPEDQTRFLLRRLQHDDDLADCWQRWRIAGEAMRGVAPSRCLPADFATRVANAIAGDRQSVPAPSLPSRAWRRWGGMAAVAASLAVTALALRPALETARPQPAAMPIATAPVAGTGSPDGTPVTGTTAAARPVPNAAQAREAQGIAAVMPATPGNAARASTRNESSGVAPGSTASVRASVDMLASATAGDAAATSAPAPVALSPDALDRPWPRAILPKPGGGSGLTVGFGDAPEPRIANNPFMPVFPAAPRLVTDRAAAAAGAGVGTDAEPPPSAGEPASDR